MTRPILCAVDFSEASDAACDAACDLGRRFHAPVVLLHVVESLPVDAFSGHETGAFNASLAERAAALESALHDALAAKLGAKAKELSQRGATVDARLLDGGRPWDVIADAARRGDARLIVMGTHGRRGPARWLLGSVAERTVRAASCPVLVLPGPRDAIREWTAGARSLRVAVGMDLKDSLPISFVRTLRAAGPCEVAAIHLYWPPAEIKRRGTRTPFSLESPPEEIQKGVEAELRAAIGTLPGSGSLALVVRPEWGRLSDPLFEIAREMGTDLLVVGTHGRHVLDGFAAGSTAFGVLKRIEIPVVFVPAAETEKRDLVGAPEDHARA